MRSYCKAKPAAGYERKIVGNGLDRSVGFGLLVFCLVISLVFYFSIFNLLYAVPYRVSQYSGKLFWCPQPKTPNSSLLTPN